jgi:hypothetical protein
MEVNGPMQIEIDTEILETIFTHATTAARLAGYLDDAIVVDGTIVIEEVGKSLEAISRLIAERLGKLYGPRLEWEPTEGGEREFDVAASVDGLRQRVARVDALAMAAEHFFEEMPKGGKRKCGRRQLERVAHLVGATIEAVRVAVVDGDRLARKLATR